MRSRTDAGTRDLPRSAVALRGLSVTEMPASPVPGTGSIVRGSSTGVPQSWPVQDPGDRPLTTSPGGRDLLDGNGPTGCPARPVSTDVAERALAIPGDSSRGAGKGRGANGVRLETSGLACAGMSALAARSAEGTGGPEGVAGTSGPTARGVEGTGEPAGAAGTSAFAARGVEGTGGPAIRRARSPPSFSPPGVAILSDAGGSAPVSRSGMSQRTLCAVASPARRRGESSGPEEGNRVEGSSARSGRGGRNVARPATCWASPAR